MRSMLSKTSCFYFDVASSMELGFLLEWTEGRRLRFIIAYTYDSVMGSMYSSSTTRYTFS